MCDRKLKAGSAGTLRVYLWRILGYVMAITGVGGGGIRSPFLQGWPGRFGLVAVFFLSLMQSKHTHKNTSQIYDAKLLSKKMALAQCLMWKKGNR